MNRFNKGDAAPDGGSLFRKTTTVRMWRQTEPFECESREGTLTGQPGDWLAQDGHGGFYPISAEFHAANYASADESTMPQAGEGRSRLRKAIASAINSVSAENGSNTPDFVLADFLVSCLDAFDRASRRREAWFGQPMSVTAKLHWKRISPHRNAEGSLCGLCDGTYAHEHPRVKCSRCGKEGLQENWPFDCCGVAR